MSLPEIIRVRNIYAGMLLLGILVCNVAGAQDKHIDVTVNGNKLLFLNSECPERPSDMGCVMAERGSSPVISWELTGQSSEGWRFSRLEFSPVPLQDCTLDDFALTEADRQTGAASTAQVVADGRRLQIRDRNRNVCITQYTLYAVSEGGMEIDSDPIIDNRGGGN